MPAVSEGPVSDHGGARRLPGVPSVVRVTTSRGPGNLVNFPDTLAGIRSGGDDAKSQESPYGEPGHRRIGVARPMTTASMPGAFSEHGVDIPCGLRGFKPGIELFGWDAARRGAGPHRNQKDG